MPRSIRSRIAWVVIVGMLAITYGPKTAESQPRRAKYATKADLQRLEKQLEEQRELVVKLIKLQQQYLQSLLALTGDGASATVAVAPTPPVEKPVEKPVHRPKVKDVPRSRPERVARPKSGGFGTIVGKVKGGGGQAVVYIEHAAPPVRGSAKMKQQGKQFVPRVLVVQKGTKVEFPNMDAVFHNVFSVTPDNSFDLGSYRQGQSKSVTLVRPGVVTVYCNMHPQMVGHVLVVPSPLYTRAGSDGFYKIANVPAGRHRIVAWAPNAKPVVSTVEVSDAETETVEFAVRRRGSTLHTNKDGMPYGSYKD